MHLLATYISYASFSIEAVYIWQLTVHLKAGHLPPFFVGFVYLGICNNDVTSLKCACARLVFGSSNPNNVVYYL